MYLILKKNFFFQFIRYLISLNNKNATRNIKRNGHVIPGEK